MKIRIIGAGLAGCEAAYYLSKCGYEIELYEMRPKKYTGAHKTEKFGELVCSNSLRSDSLENAVGILKREMEVFDSLIIKAARLHSVSAGGALAVDREGYSEYVTNVIKELPNVTIINEDAITGQEKVYEIVSGARASVKVTGPRTIIDSLDSKSFRATADLSELAKISRFLGFFRKKICVFSKESSKNT